MAKNKLTADEPLNGLAEPLDEAINMRRQPPGRIEETAEDMKLEGIDLEKINAIISSDDVQKGGFIRLSRRGAFDQKFSYMCRLAPEDFDIERIKKLYGGGEYQGRTFRANGQMYKMFEFNIDSRFKGQLDVEALSRAAADDGTSVNKSLLEAALSGKPSSLENNPNFVGKLMETMSAKSDSTIMMMMQMMQQQSQQAIAAQASNMQLMVAMITTMGNKQPAGMDPILLEILKDKATGDPMERVLKLVTMAKGLVADAKPEREPTMLENIVSAAAPAVASMFGARQAGPPQTQVITGPSPQAQAPQPAQVQQPTPDMQQGFMIRQFLGQVLAAAKRNSDPAIYVDMIFDMTSDDQLGQIRANLTDAAWPVNIFGDDPRAVQFRPWLEELKKLLLEDVTNITTENATPGDGVQQPESTNP